MELIKSERTLGVFRLMMITVISVDSIRNLPIAAQYGMALVTFYVIAGLTFFLPLILITIRFAGEYPSTGGSYLWIEDAFGKKVGFLSVWLQWVYQLIWYPTIFAFICSTIASLIHPVLVNDNWFILFLSLFLFWIMTLFSMAGIRMTSIFSALGAILGTLLPMLVVIALAAFWLWSGRPSEVHFSLHSLVPGQGVMNNLGFFANILFSLLGLDVAAMHAGNVLRPEQTYRRAMSLSGITILVSLILSSLALCIVVAPEKIGLLNGLMEAFQLFFNAYHLGALLPLIGLSVIIGSLGIAFAWMIGLARGLQVACQDCNVLKPLQALNSFGMPDKVLMVQAIIYSVLVGVFLAFPNVNNSYWVLSALTAQFALIYYVLLFVAVIKLQRREKPEMKKKDIPLFLLVLAIITSIFGIGVGFLPPSSVAGHSAIVKYEFILIMGFVLFCSPLFFIFRWMQKPKVAN